jgi:2-keto-4-pentenoate hydratase
MDDAVIEQFAREMTGVYRNHSLVRATEVDIQTLSREDAYAVQKKYLSERIASGERPAGYKIGCTSPAIRAQFGLSEPVCGRLMTPQVYQDGDTLDISRYVDCALEPELVLHLGMDLDGDNLASSHLLGAISAVSPGIEVHNYRFWYGRPTAQELIASNAIHAAIVVGKKYDLPSDIDLARERTTLMINEVEVATGLGIDIMGGPIESLRWLLQHLQKRGARLLEGDLVIPGSATKLVSVGVGDHAKAVFTHFGSCQVSFRAG